MILVPSPVCEAFISLFLLPHEVAVIIRVLPAIIDQQNLIAHPNHGTVRPFRCSCLFDVVFSFVNADGALTTVVALFRPICHSRSLSINRDSYTYDESFHFLL